MIVVVSGLPRSGTSLLMQMLAAGGMPVLTDQVRAPDTDNPRGYFEWEPAKLLPRQPQLIREAEGKAVKIVSSLLWALPPGHDYRVLFMERPLIEVAASQVAMIRRRGACPSLEGRALIAALDAHRRQALAHLKERGFACCVVRYHDVLAAPGQEAVRIAQFLGLELDCEAMARQADPTLYRQRLSHP
ncbi:MAG: hypothetical protein RMI94_12745 [Bryobacterales bacterium]|nr:sulfotransferase [Bryobacteraceae bacterium]MDW8131410.1 hypothetical protein [Bryobacterales bacterium]